MDRLCYRDKKLMRKLVKFKTKQDLQINKHADTHVLIDLLVEYIFVRDSISIYYRIVFRFTIGRKICSQKPLQYNLSTSNCDVPHFQPRVKRTSQI